MYELQLAKAIPLTRLLLSLLVPVNANPGIPIRWQCNFD